ncbi:MAG: P-loop NTPase [Infirmifilum sp.]
MEQDFRLPIIKERLSSVKLVLPVASPKGGVGKTTVSSALAVLLARKGIPTGIFDLDFTNPTTHIMLGVDAASLLPEEEKGILPVGVEPNLEFLSPAFYSKDKPLPLRGQSVVEALREILAITRWSSRVLVVDTPPGLSDAMLEFLRLHRNAKVLVVTTCDRLSLVSTKRMFDYLRQERVGFVGVVANMCGSCREITEALGVEPLACLPFQERLHESMGDRDRLVEVVGRDLEKVLEAVRLLI